MSASLHPCTQCRHVYGLYMLVLHNNETANDPTHKEHDNHLLDPNLEVQFHAKKLVG